MTAWTVHTHPTHPPVFVKESWSLLATLFGPLWLLLHRAWIPAILVIAVSVAIGAYPDPVVQSALSLGLAILVGLNANELYRWSLGRRGYSLVHVVFERDADRAFARVVDQWPELAASLLPKDTTR
jgi:hypothetical protein